MKIKNSFLFVISLLFFSIVNYSCKEDKNSITNAQPEGEFIPDNVFPLTAGHQFGFSGYLTSGSTETPIPNSETNFSASWAISSSTNLASVLPPASVAHLAKTSSPLIIDIVSAPGFLAQPDTTPVFAYYDSTFHEYYYLTNFGRVFRQYEIRANATAGVRGDSLRFIKLAAPAVKTLHDFQVFQEEFDSYKFNPSAATKLKINLVGNFEKKENLQLRVNNIDTVFTTYYLVITSYSTLGLLDPLKSINAKFWLSPGVGPVQMFLAGDDEAPGSFRKLKSKNF